MPQHFQAFDAHLEEELDRRFRILEPHAFGVSQLEIDDEALVRGIFQVRRLSAVLPDGTFVSIGPEHSVKEAVVLIDGALPGGARKAEIHLGVPSDAARGTPMYVGDPGASDARWVRTNRVLKDAYGSAGEAEIEHVRPNAQLLLGTTDRRSYITLKLAELELSENGALVVSEHFVPPSLAISASRALLSRLSRVITSMGAKQDMLASRYRGRSMSLVEFGTVDMVTFWYLHALNSSLPRMAHMARVGRVHPERLYLLLAEVEGMLSTFEPQRKAKEIPPYNHLALAETLYPIFDQILVLLATSIAQQYKPISLEQVQSGLFVAQKIDPTLLKKSQLYLVAGGNISEESLRKELPAYVRVGAVDQIMNIVHAAVPGLDVRIDLAPPTAIPVRPENIYLRLSREGPHWTEIMRTSSIAIFQPVKPQDVQLELIAVEI